MSVADESKAVLGDSVESASTGGPEDPYQVTAKTVEMSLISLQQRQMYAGWAAIFGTVFVAVGYLFWALFAMSSHLCDATLVCAGQAPADMVPAWTRVEGAHQLQAYSISMLARASVFAGLTIILFGIGRFVNSMTMPFEVQVRLAEAKSKRQAPESVTSQLSAAKELLSEAKKL